MKTEYKDYISDTHIYEHRKTWHNVRSEDETMPYKHLLFKKRPIIHVQNEKRRTVVQKRLKKITKYLRRAWNGYRFGVVLKK